MREIGIGVDIGIDSELSGEWWVVSGQVDDFVVGVAGGVTGELVNWWLVPALIGGKEAGESNV